MEYPWYKLYASSNAEGLYLVEDNLPTEPYLYEREIRDLLSSTGTLANRKHLSLDFAMVQFAWRSAMSLAAMHALQDRLAGYVEWLPLELQDGREFFLPHPLVVADSLDTQKSSVTYLSDYPRTPEYVTSVHQEWMRDVDELKNVPMFRTPETLCREVYVSADVVEFIQSTKLTGVGFSPVRSSDSE